MLRITVLLLVCLIAGCVYDPYGPYAAGSVYTGGTVIIGGQQYLESPVAWRLVALASGAVSRILALASSPAVGWFVKRSINLHGHSDGRLSRASSMSASMFGIPGLFGSPTLPGKRRAASLRPDHGFVLLVWPSVTSRPGSATTVHPAAF